ncbi:MAG: hypothetical protein JJT96_20780 [Opitutales bacterium]|nr:hypothetical protein [Opitutales bacterium]
MKKHRAVTYTYYETNRLKTVTDWHNRVTTYHWTDAGELRRIDRPNGVNRVQTYTPAGELERITERDEDGKLLAYFRFRYDANARIERRLRLPQPQEVNLPPFAAMYDNDNRLATWNGTTVVHDADGNMTTGPLFGHGLTTYVYDARDRLTSAGGVTYEYDAENQRVSLTTAAGPVRYVTDPNAGGLSRLLVRERPDGSRTFYVYGLGLLYEIDEAGAATYYHFDQIGSTVMLTDSDGAVSDRIEYSPYGTITHWEGETDTPFLYVGQFGVQTDPNGLLYMRARYYSPELRRFINADPIRFGGGMNWYAYANGNPTMIIDPTGLFFNTSRDLTEGPNSLWEFPNFMTDFAAQVYMGVTHIPAQMAARGREISQGGDPVSIYIGGTFEFAGGVGSVATIPENLVNAGVFAVRYSGLSGQEEKYRANLEAKAIGFGIRNPGLVYDIFIRGKELEYIGGFLGGSAVFAPLNSVSRVGVGLLNFSGAVTGPVQSFHNQFDSFTGFSSGFFNSNDGFSNFIFFNHSSSFSVGIK